MAFPPIGVQSARHPSVAINAFGRRLGDYKNWRDELAAIIGDYQAWVEAQGLGHGDDDLRVYEIIDTLKSDRIAIALVAEFSRGKTELINAIFFADYKQRLLPSDAGRTTMCPTELLYDESEAPCLKLLPINTRQSSLTIAEYKRLGSYWKTLPLDIKDPKAMAQSLHEIVKTQWVSESQAEELGLFDRAAPNGMATKDGNVEIPEWRHAIINFPHPLLKQGLVVLDTPGLNSLGTEPELTMSMLPQAQAVIFVLAADTGVTKSDLHVWRHHVCANQQGPGKGHLVALNKVDALWDELRSADAIASSLEHQIDETARVLDIARDAVFPVSAQKGLLGRIKGDESLIERSGLRALEQKLCTDVIQQKQALVRDKVAHEIGAIVDRTRAMIEARLTSVRLQLDELNELSGKSREAIHHMIDHMAAEKSAYEEALREFQATRSILSQQTKILLDYLNVEAFDKQMARIHDAMKAAWTTQGLRSNMKALFDSALDTMDKANMQAQAILEHVTSAHEKFHREHGLAQLHPTEFSLGPYRARLQRLHEEAELFRNSPLTLIIEQHLLIKKFFVTLAGRARAIYGECAVAAQQWSKAIMTPILAQAREHKLMMDGRLENLKRIHENHDSLNARIAELDLNRQKLENQLLIIDNMLNKIGRPLPPTAAR
jgi:hypothetical protein